MTETDTEQEARLREGLTIRASYVSVESGVALTVTIGQGKVFVKIGNMNIHLTNFAAEALGRELMAAGVKCQYGLEVRGEQSE